MVLESRAQRHHSLVKDLAAILFHLLRARQRPASVQARQEDGLMPNIQTYLNPKEFKRLQNKLLRLNKKESAYLKELVLKDLQQ
jgi:hypothetical protein